MIRFTPPSNEIHAPSVLAFAGLLTLLTLGFLPDARAARVIDRTVVAVNDDVILESDINRFIEKSKSKSFQELFGGIDPAQLNNRDTVLQLLIEEKIIEQQVERLDLSASDQEVEGQIRAITQRNGITRDQLAARLKQLGTTMAEYKEGIRRQIERRNLVEREIRPNLEISEEKLSQYYRRTQGGSKADTQYQIAHIYVDPDKQSGVGAERRAEQIWKEVSENPENFDKLAAEYSDDLSTAESGGKLGLFSLDSLVTEFRKVVPSTPVGQVTKPIRTSAGFHIVKVLDRSVADFSSLSAEEKAALRNALVAEELEKKMAAWLERKTREAHIRRFSRKGK